MLKNKKIIALSLILILASTIFYFSQPYLDKNYYIKTKINTQIDALGIKLLMPEKQVAELIGYKGKYAMCISGYEYDYNNSGLNVGFNINTDKVRRITITNDKNSIYGIHKGMTLKQARAILIGNQFAVEKDSTSNFTKENLRITVISMKGTNVDGITVEILD